MSDIGTEPGSRYLYSSQTETVIDEERQGTCLKVGRLKIAIPEWFARVNNRLLDYYVGIALLVLWEMVLRLKWVDTQFLPAPTTILAEGAKLVSSGELFVHIAASLQRTMEGLVVAMLVGIPLGFVLAGWFPRLTRFLDPLLSLLGQINAFSLFPLFVLFFGIGELAKFSIIFWSCLWPVLFTTIAGVRGVDPLYVKLARSMGSGHLTLFAKVLLPGALPSIFTGIRLGATVAFLMLIAAEMIGANNGLGWLIHNANINFIIPRLYLGAVVIATLGTGINALIYWLEARVVTWKSSPDAA